MASLKVKHWSPEKDGPLSTQSMGQKLWQKGYHYIENSFHAGTVLQEHAHSEPRKDAVIAGKLKVVMGGSEVILGPGDILDVPVGMEHTATVVGDQTVIILEGALADLEPERWDPAVDGTHISAETVGRKLASQGYTYMQQTFGPGSILADHAHREPTKDAVISGRLKMELFGKEVVLGPGDMIEIPPGVQHRTSVVGNEICVMFESAIVELMVEHWNNNIDGPLSLQNMAKKLRGQGYHYVQQVYAPSTVFHDHSHEQSTKDAIITGRLRVTMQSKTVILEPGDIINIPAGIEHSAEVVDCHHVVVLEAETGRIHRIHWNAVEDGPLSVENMEKKMLLRGYKTKRESFPAGTSHSEHTHAEPRADAVISGQLKTTMFGQEILLNPGDILEIPIGIEHSAAVVGNQPVVLLDGELGALTVTSWDASKEGPLNVHAMEKKLKLQGYHCTLHTYPPGLVQHSHSHEEPRKDAIISGQLKFEMFGKVVTLQAGDVIKVPLGIEHNTAVVGTEPVVAFDAIKGDVKIEHWNPDSDGPLTEENIAKKLKTAGFRCMKQEYNPGTVLNEHSHEEPRKGAVVSGQVKIGMFGKSVVLQPGDIIHVPEGVDHDVVVVGNQPVILLDASK